MHLRYYSYYLAEIQVPFMGDSGYPSIFHFDTQSKFVLKMGIVFFIVKL
jgi:hypothetical protein